MDSKRTSRRELLKGGATLAGGLTLGVPVHAQTHDDHASGPASGSENAYPMIPGNKEMVAYGERSHFVTSVRIQHPMGKSPDEFGKLFHVASPIQDQFGSITPSALHYIATTRQAFVPDIDPKQHTLMIHGLVDRPLTFTMDDLRRFPSVSRLHFLECAGNRHNARHKTVQESHGMTSCSEWTGVMLSTLLEEAGVDPQAKWFVAEGADGKIGIARGIIGVRILRLGIARPSPAVELPTFAAAVHDQNFFVAVVFQLPECPRGKPVVVVAVEDDSRLRRDSGFAEQFLEGGRRREIAADGVLQFGLPVPGNGAVHMALIVGGRVNVNFYNADAGVFRVSGNPFGGYEYFWMRIVRHNVSLSP